MAFICLMTAAMGLAGGFWSMFIVRDLLGVGDSIGWSVGEATIGEEVPERWHGVSQAIFTAGYTLIGAGLGAIIITRLTRLDRARVAAADRVAAEMVRFLDDDTASKVAGEIALLPKRSFG